MKKTIFTLLLLAAGQAGFVAQAQQPQEIAEGYYTMSPFSLSGKEYVFSYDTDASRSPYGNASDYDNPCGKNGEVAYLYAVPSAGTPLVNSAYYFKPLGNGTYSVQSLSGEAYSYLSVAEYDRRLLIHTPQFSKAFSTKTRCKDGSSQWGEREYTVRQYKYAGLCDTLSSASNGYETMTVLTRVEDSRITPAMSIRRPLSDAKGALAVYKVGDNPGEVSAMVAYGLTQLVDEAQTLADDKSTTEEQAEDMTARLQEATRQYLETAPTAMRPVEDGYYFVVNAYRAFLMRQKKEKTLSATLSDGERTLTWRDISVNDGGVAFHITPSGDGTFEMASYDRSLVLDGMLVNYDAEGTWTIASSADPEALMTAANQTKSLRTLYGKNTADSIAFDREGHLYSGYTASWYLRKAYHQVTVPSTGWAVLSTSFPVELNDSVEAYTVSEKDGNLYMKPLSSVVPARTAVLIHAAKGTYTLPSTTKNAPAVDDNLLVAVNEPLKGLKSGTIRILKIVSGQVGFSKSASTSVVAGSAYLPYNEGEDDFRPFVDVEDGLSSVGTDALEKGTQAYDLMGRKVDASRQKKNDIYIINNKKILKR
jgi:hypothetical protein